MQLANRRRAVIVYGTGSSHDSGYRVRVKLPPSMNDEPEEEFEMLPPFDKDFFGLDKEGKPLADDADGPARVSQQSVWGVAHRFPSLGLFIKNYYGVNYETQRSNFGLEDVWSSVDLNLKHLYLNTYNWESQNSEYNRKYRDALGKGRLYYLDPLDAEPDPNRDRSHSTPKKFLGDCGRHLTWLVYMIYGYPVVKAGAEDNYAVLHKVLKSEGYDIEYVSFNYDTILEMSLKKAEYDAKEKGETYRFRYASDYESDQIPFDREKMSNIFKLHGSLSWGSRSSILEPLKMGRTDRRWVSEDEWSIEMAARPNYTVTDQYQPAIIPPTWFKKEINDEAGSQQRLSQLILHQWRMARIALLKANVVIIVGYSFPRIDFHSQRLFRLARMEKGEEFRILYCVKTPEHEAREALSFLNLAPYHIDIEPEGFTTLVKSDVGRRIGRLVGS